MQIWSLHLTSEPISHHNIESQGLNTHALTHTCGHVCIWCCMEDFTTVTHMFARAHGIQPKKYSYHVHLVVRLL